MMIGVFDLSEVDQGDFYAVERHWNAWVAELGERGLRPAEHPLDDKSTPERHVYSVHPLGGLDDFNTRVQHAAILTSANLRPRAVVGAA